MAMIYLSCTYEDLKDYRRVVFETTRKSGHHVIAMEEHGAADQRLVDKCLKVWSRLMSMLVARSIVARGERLLQAFLDNASVKGKLCRMRQAVLSRLHYFWSA